MEYDVESQFRLELDLNGQNELKLAKIWNKTEWIILCTEYCTKTKNFAWNGELNGIENYAHNACLMVDIIPTVLLTYRISSIPLVVMASTILLYVAHQMASNLIM